MITREGKMKKSFQKHAGKMKESAANILPRQLWSMTVCQGAPCPQLGLLALCTPYLSSTSSFDRVFSILATEPMRKSPWILS